MLEIPQIEVEEGEEEKKAKNNGPEEGETKQIPMTNSETNNDENLTKTTRIEGDQEIQTVLTSKARFADVFRKFAAVCTELKLLYVAITRPKTMLLIYD